MSYTNPENALKNAQELKAEGNIDAALEELHQALHGKKFRGNNIILERIMLEMIEICSDNLTTQYLKEDIGHFRNVCQHTNMSLLENVLKRLKDKTDEIIKTVEEQEGEDKLRSILSEDSPTNIAFLSGTGGEVEIHPDDLIYMASCQYEQIEEKQKVMPSIIYFMDICKIILDTLRQNSKMLDFYNQTAVRCFEFCSKYNYKSEYTKVSETLHSHFNQILKSSKNPDLLAQQKIPFPVKLDEDDAQQKVLELRYQQLKIALKMQVWSDAFRTSENIYQLINRTKQHQLHQSRMKQILADFFDNLSQIFWESEFYLFHAYAIMNLQQIYRSSKALTDQQKAKMNAQFLLAALSVPLNNKLSNFERLSVQYNPPSMNQFYQESPSVRSELFNIANMLQIKGIPSRHSLITQMKLKNLHLSRQFPQIQELFRLIEEEESPFTISKKGKSILEDLLQTPEWAKYHDFLKKTLAVRILQKSKNYFKNLKMATLKNLLCFYSTFDEIEILLYECNREGLSKTIIDHKTQSLTFDQEVEVAQHLLSFGVKLKEAFLKVRDVTSEGKERERIFLKVKEKLDQEMSEVLKRKEDMIKMKEDIARNQAEESKSLQEILQVQQQQKEKQFAQQQVKEEKERQKNKLNEELMMMRKIRAKEVLQEIARRGIKKIGSVKISEMERKEDLDYDNIMNFYQNLLKKEKEAFEVEKKNKLKDVEYWARSIREEEKVAIQKYAQDHGEEEMKQIQIAINERHSKELKMKQSLEKAFPVFQKFKASIMEQRRIIHNQQVEKFIDQIGEELQNKIVEEAKAELKKIENLRLVKEREQLLKKQFEERLAKEKEQRKVEGVDESGESTGGWARGTQKAPIQAAGEDKGFRGSKGAAGEDGGSGFISRTAMGKAAPVTATAQEEEKKVEDSGPKKPSFTRQVRKDDKKEEGGFLNRSAMGQQKKEEEKKEPIATSGKEFKSDKKDTGTGGAGPWRSTGGPGQSSNQERPRFTGSQRQEGSGFSKGGAKPEAQQQQQQQPAPKKGNEKGDDDWNFSGGSMRKGGRK